MANLIKCGIPKRKAYVWGNTRLGYWRIAKSHIADCVFTNDRLRRAGYPTLWGEYLGWRP